MLFSSLLNILLVNKHTCAGGWGLGVETGRSAGTRTVWSSYDEESPASSVSRGLTPPPFPPSSLPPSPPPPPPGGGRGGVRTRLTELAGLSSS
jgi:hypothetical protein